MTRERQPPLSFDPRTLSHKSSTEGPDSRRPDLLRREKTRVWTLGSLRPLFRLRRMVNRPLSLLQTNNLGCLYPHPSTTLPVPFLHRKTVMEPNTSLPHRVRFPLTHLRFNTPTCPESSKVRVSFVVTPRKSLCSVTRPRVQGPHNL